MGEYFSSLLCSIIFLRNYMAIRPDKLSARMKIWLCAAFICATWLAAVATWSGPLSIALALGSSCVTYAFFFLGGIRLRLVIGMNCLIWLSNAIVYESPWQFAGSMPFCVELDNLKDTDAHIHQPAAMLVAAD